MFPDYVNTVHATTQSIVDELHGDSIIPIKERIALHYLFLKEPIRVNTTFLQAPGYIQAFKFTKQICDIVSMHDYLRVLEGPAVLTTTGALCLTKISSWLKLPPNGDPLIQVAGNFSHPLGDHIRNMDFQTVQYADIGYSLPAKKYQEQLLKILRKEYTDA